MNLLLAVNFILGKFLAKVGDLPFQSRHTFILRLKMSSQLFNLQLLKGHLIGQLLAHLLDLFSLEGLQSILHLLLKVGYLLLVDNDLTLELDVLLFFEGESLREFGLEELIIGKDLLFLGADPHSLKVQRGFLIKQILLKAVEGRQLS